MARYETVGDVGAADASHHLGWIEKSGASWGCKCRKAEVHLGRDAEAREAAARLLEVDPAFTISAWIAGGGQSNSKLLVEGLRKAGLPE
jgi:hypothetical protein